MVAIKIVVGRVEADLEQFLSPESGGGAPKLSDHARDPYPCKMPRPGERPQLQSIRAGGLLKVTTERFSRLATFTSTLEFSKIFATAFVARRKSYRRERQ